MKSFEEIKQIVSLNINYIDNQCIKGIIHLPKWYGSIVITNSHGWDHVSVSPANPNKVPTWDEMCKIKSLFFNDDEAVIEIYPSKEDYVNLKGNCLHLWRCNYREMVLPPSILAGPKGRSINLSDVERELKEAQKIVDDYLDKENNKDEKC